MNFLVPIGCCQGANVTNAQTCQKKPAEQTPKLDSCYYKFEQTVTNHAKIIMAVAIVVVVVMVSCPQTIAKLYTRHQNT